MPTVMFGLAVAFTFTVAGVWSSEWLRTHPNQMSDDSVTGTARMINATVARLSEWNFIMRMKFKGTRTKFKVCSASIISNKFAITAAHCIANITEYPQNVKLYPLGNMRNEVLVSEIIAHPEAQNILRDTPPEDEGDPETDPGETQETTEKKPWDYDVALLKFKSPLTLTNDINSIALPNQDFDITDASNVQCKSAGWGSASTFKTIAEFNAQFYQVTRRLREIAVPVVRIEECATKQGGYEGYVSSFQFCGGRLGGYQMPCLGDSGSPVKCTVDDGPVKLQGYVEAGGFKCNAGKRYYVLSRVSKYADWIRKTMEVKGQDVADPGI